MVEDGQIIQHRGDDPDSFFVIASGQVKLGQYGRDGEMQVLFLLGESDSFGELACLGKFPRAVDAEAVGDVRLYCISEAEFTDVLLTEPKIAMNVMSFLAQQLREAMDHLVMHRKMPAPQRLARSLLMLCKDKKAPVVLDIRHQELAELVGVSRVSIAKTLTILDKNGILDRGYGKLVINDPDALHSWHGDTVVDKE